MESSETGAACRAIHAVPTVVVSHQSRVSEAMLAATHTAPITITDSTHADGGRARKARRATPVPIVSIRPPTVITSVPPTPRSRARLVANRR